MMSLAEQIAQLAPKMPIEVLQDVDKRTADYLASGGKPKGPYIEQQLTYMRNVARVFEQK